MNVSVNLLPDIRQQRLRQQHLRRLVTSLSILIWIIAGLVVVALLILTGAQKLQIRMLNSDIANRTSQVEGTANLNDALTVQQALVALPSLYAKRTFYSVFVSKLTAAMPTDVEIASLTTDATNVMTVSGSAGSVASVDKFYQALKAAGGTNPTFTNVMIINISKDNTGKAGYTLTATISPSAIAQTSTADTSATNTGGNQ